MLHTLSFNLLPWPKFWGFLLMFLRREVIIFLVSLLGRDSFLTIIDLPKLWCNGLFHAYIRGIIRFFRSIVSVISCKMNPKSRWSYVGGGGVSFLVPSTCLRSHQQPHWYQLLWTLCHPHSESEYGVSNSCVFCIGSRLLQGKVKMSDSC